jgi:hypothetical protein
MIRSPWAHIALQLRTGAQGMHGWIQRMIFGDVGLPELSGQITLRKVDGWKGLAEMPSDQIIDLAA